MHCALSSLIHVVPCLIQSGRSRGLGGTSRAMWSSPLHRCRRVLLNLPTQDSSRLLLETFSEGDRSPSLGSLCHCPPARTGRELSCSLIYTYFDAILSCCSASCPRQQGRDLSWPQLAASPLCVGPSQALMRPGCKEEGTHTLEIIGS